jgi:hypothetical protein
LFKAKRKTGSKHRSFGGKYRGVYRRLNLNAQQQVYQLMVPSLFTSPERAE